jgi:hypothetical protein
MSYAPVRNGKLIAQKWTYARQGPGRPCVAQEITDGVPNELLTIRPTVPAGRFAGFVSSRGYLP